MFSFASVGCRQPCFNGGRCINGVCACPTSYEGTQCRIPVGFDIRIIVPDNLTPMVGDDLSFTCEVGSGGQYRNPVWRDTRGGQITHIQEGQSSRVICLTLINYTYLFIFYLFWFKTQHLVGSITWQY